MFKSLILLFCKNFKIRCVCFVLVLVVVLFVGGIFINRLSKNNLIINILKFFICYFLILILILK